MNRPISYTRIPTSNTSWKHSTKDGSQAQTCPHHGFCGPWWQDRTIRVVKQRMSYFSLTSGKTGVALVPYMLQALDDQGLKIFNLFGLTVEQQKDPKEIYAQFEECLNHCTELSSSLAQPSLHVPGEGWYLDQFYTCFRGMSIKCDFTSDEETERFIEQLLASTPMADFRKWLLGQNSDVKIEAVLEEGWDQKTTENTN